MIVPRLIQRKRDGDALAAEEWRALVEGYIAGRVPDYQVSALLMAVVWRGLTDAELAALTDAMVASGDRLRFEGLDRPVVDKHSTGGVGDKASLLLGPMVASCGVAVPMMSGRGLGHTGGTVDKLEAIPGFRTTLSLAETEAQVRRIGCAMIAQTDEIAPADRKLYALRDVTATVESIPLIAASIMSKKLAEGLHGLVLDVKIGSGAFLPQLEDAIALARSMILLGETRGCRTVALVTAMDRPLGRACGNALEVEEAIQGLTGEGPPDLMEVVYALGAEMLLVAGVETEVGAARQRLCDSVTSGRAAETFARIIAAQGGDAAVVEDPDRLPHARDVELFTAPASGTVARVEPRPIGHAIVAMGGGRTRLEDTVDPTVGFVLDVKPGDRVRQGEPIASIYARDRAGIQIGREALQRAIQIGAGAEPLPLVSHRITATGVERV